MDLLSYAQKGWKKLGNSTLYSGIADLADAEPELFIQLLKVPSLKNFSGARSKLEKAPENWMRDFLNLGGLECLLDGLSSLCSSRKMGFSSALEQLECARCIKIVMNSPSGLDAMVENSELTRSLVRGLLESLSCLRCGFYR